MARMTRTPLTLFALAICAVPVETRAQFDAQQKQAQCELRHIGDTRSQLAISWIRTACNRLAIDAGFLDERNRRFHGCLLQSLPGAQSDAAADAIISACRTANPL
jgi:hypothetical protein